MKIEVGDIMKWAHVPSEFRVLELLDDNCFRYIYLTGTQQGKEFKGTTRGAVLVSKQSIKEDVIVSPPHYTTTKISALDVVNDWELDFYLGNTIKYIKRYKLKGNPVQDLQKAAQYLDLKIKLLEKDGEGK